MGDACNFCQLCSVSWHWKASLAGVGVWSLFLPPSVLINLTSSWKLPSATFQAERAFSYAPVWHVACPQTVWNAIIRAKNYMCRGCKALCAEIMQQSFFFRSAFLAIFFGNFPVFVRVSHLKFKIKFCLVAVVSKIVSLPSDSSSRAHLQRVRSNRWFYALASSRGRIKPLKEPAGTADG